MLSIVQFLLFQTTEGNHLRPGFAVKQSWTSSSSTPTAITEFLCNTDSTLFPSFTSAKNACRRGLIYIDGKKAQVSDMTHEGSVIENMIRVNQGDFITKTQGRSVGEKGNGFHLQVAYEDNHCAVIVKPRGMPVFRTGGGGSGNGPHKCTIGKEHVCASVQSALPYSLTPITSTKVVDGHNDDHAADDVDGDSVSIDDVSDSVDDDDGEGTIQMNVLRRPQPVHRIDKETGGLLLIAKTKPALVHLTAQFAQKNTAKGGVYKRYCALTLSDRPVTTAYGSIDTPLSGLEAHTSFTVLSTIPTTIKHSSVEEITPVSFPVVGMTEHMERISVHRTANTIDINNITTSVWNLHNDMSEAVDTTFDDNNVQHRNTHDSFSPQTTPSLSTPIYNGKLHLSTVLVDITTGRTHQIRKHMDMLGMPIFGDPIYWFCTGGRTGLGSTYGTSDHRNNGTCHHSNDTINASNSPYVNPSFALRRLDLGMALFSIGISFLHPVDGDRITVQIVPEPHTFQNIRNELIRTMDELDRLHNIINALS